MSTRLYLRSTGTAAASPAVGSVWDITSSLARLPMATTKANTAFTRPLVSESTTTSPVDVVMRQWVSEDTIPSGRTIAGSFSAVFRVSESALSADFFTQIRIAIVSGDGSTTRGELFAGQTQTSVSATTSDNNAEWPQSELTRILTSVSCSSVAASTGDRLVIEVGFRALNTTSSTRTASLEYGDPTATGDYSLAAEVGTQLVPWVEFTEDIFAAAPTTHSGDADLAVTASLTTTADTTLAGAASVAVTADLTATGDVTTPSVTHEGDADLDVTAGLTASPPIIGTVTDNRAGGIRLSGTFPLEFDPAVEPLPTGLSLGERVIAATAFDGVTVTGTVAAYDHTTVSKYRRRTRIVIGGKDVTTWRGVETQVTYQYVAPLLYGPATVTLPQANLAFERPGHDALKWLKKFATVKVQRLNSEGEVTSTDYRGFVVALDTDGSGITVQVGGEASGRAALRWKQLPVFQSRIGVERLAFRAIKEMGLRFKPRLGGANTGVTLGRFGGTGQLDYLSQLCARAQRKDGTLFSIMPDDDGDYRMEAKDTTTIHATVYIDGTRVKGNLRSDAAEEPNRIFATAVTPNGERLTGRTAPGLQQTDPLPPFPGHMEEGDSGPGVDLLLTGLMMTDLLDRTDSPGGYDDDVVEAVQDLQNEAGLSETGEVNEATWNALWDLDVTGFSLDWATRQPAAQKDEVKKWKRTPSGAIIRANLDYDARVPKVDLDVDMGAGVTRRQRKRYARGELQQSQSDNWVGTIEVTTGAVIEGEHNPGDPLTEADLMDVRDVKPGMNIWAPTFDGGTLFHVSGSDPLAGTLMVDTRARDTLKVWEIIQRNRETRSNPARAWERAHRASGELKDSVIEWDGIGGQLGAPVEVPANTWVVFPVVAGQEGTVSRLRLNTSPNAEFVCAVFGRSIRAKRLEMIIGNPLTEAGYDRWTDEDKRDRLDGRILLYTAGAWDNPCGYFPKSKLRPDGEESGADLTGKWYDEAGFAFRTFKYPVLYVAVYADRDTEIPAGQVMWPLLEPGA